MRASGSGATGRQPAYRAAGDLGRRESDLFASPVKQVVAIYDGLGLAGFASLREPLEAYLRSIAGYRKNEYTELVEPLRRRIAREWRRSFDEWGYAG